jgi:hypothetical protein
VEVGLKASGEELQDPACAVLTGAAGALDGVRWAGAGDGLSWAFATEETP